MQWQIEDAMLFALPILDELRAVERFDRDSIAAAEQRVHETLAENRGR